MIHKIKDTGTDIEKRNLVGTNTDEELGSIGVNLGRVATSKYNANAIAACIVYLVCSVCMVLINKIISNAGAEAARSGDFPVYFVILFQCFAAVIFVELAKLVDIIDEYHVTWEIFVSLLPLSLLFVCMLCTGFFSLALCSVPIVTVFKNLTNIIIVTGDVWIFNEKISNIAMFAVAAMSLGALMLGFNDMDFNIEGYFWMVLHIVSTAGYTLYTRYACKNISISKFGLIFFNNSVSIVLLIPIAYYVGDMDSIVAHIDTLSSPSFLAYNFLAGFFGFYLSVSALWCVGATSATTLAILGSMNKIPITLLGFLLFPESAVITNQGISFMMLSVVGGIVYTYSKLKSDLK